MNTMKIKEYMLTTNEQMSVADIAKELKITRAGTYGILKRGLGKVYKEMKKENDSGPFETAVSIAIGLGIDDYGYAELFKMFPPAIKKEIETDGKNLVR